MRCGKHPVAICLGIFLGSLLAVALGGCAQSPSSVVREATVVEREHLQAFLVEGARALTLHARPDSTGRVLMGWIEDPMTGKPSSAVWRFDGQDSSSAGAFAPLTATSERLASPPEVIRLTVTDRETAAGDALRWLDSHPPAGDTIR